MDSVLSKVSKGTTPEAIKTKLSGAHGSTNVDTLNFNVSLPNVENYEDFKYAMQHDKNFENMVQDMTVNRLFNGSSIKKYKYH